ncbi:Serine-aspartate repeat-containing protein D [Kordia antarctica]|uniref:Serine-aspartate repeat-containing protein D n=1 Tax=Kordia antarctica TaxID=1218801 RepID=A0A7L4ZL39_9FLAO|nr:SdrD B-like domain-containing protein [Kordia antarctica]QHI37438.1 Serine-aspartate repeat-containing protein D [Kordia antarctica]
MKTKITLLVLTVFLGLTNVFANSMPSSENIVENEIMTTGDNSIIISAGKRIYTLDMNTYQATLLATSPYVNEINSIASDNTTGWIFYVSNHISRYNWTIYGYNVYTNTHKNFGSVRNYFTSTGHAYSSRGLASGGATFYNGKLYFAMEYPTYCYYGRGENSGNENPKDELSNNVRTAGTVSNSMFTNGPVPRNSNSMSETDAADSGREGEGETAADFVIIDGEEANALNDLVSDYVPEEDLPVDTTADDTLQQRGTSNAESGSSYYSSSYNNRMYLLEISFNGLSDASGSTASVSNGRPVYDNWGYSSFRYRGELGDIVVDDNGQLYAATSYQVQAYNFNSNRYDWANNEDVYAQMAKDKNSALQLLKNKRQCSTSYYYGCPHTSCTKKSFVQSYTAPSSLRTYNNLQIGSLNEITGLNSYDVGKITDASDYVRLTPPVSYKIEGFAFDDNNENGNLDSGETKLDGVAVTLYADNNTDGVLDAGDTVIESQNTNATGDYTFNNVQVANTLVQVTVPSNDASFTYTLTTAEVVAVTGSTADITGIKFGINKQPVVVNVAYDIFGTVYDDNNENAALEAGEAGLNNVTLTLYADTNTDGVLDAGDTVITTTTSGTDGSYSFLHVCIQNTIVAVTVPTSTGNYTYTLTTPPTQAIDSINTNVTGVDFGINEEQVINYNISGTVFDDDNANGVVEAGEETLENVTVTLYADNNNNGTQDAGDTVISSANTIVTGTYNFTNVTIENTVVVVTVPTNTVDFTYTLTTAGEQNTSSTTTDVTGVDFGINKVLIVDYNISGTVFDDDNTNGVNDAEAGLDNVTMMLYADNNIDGAFDTGDTMITSTTTAVDGGYAFSNVTEEHTLVMVSVPANTPNFTYASTTPELLAVNSTLNDVNDKDFGINKVQVIDYNISGTVFDDDNANGTQDAGDGVLNGVTVTLYADNNSNGTVDAGDTTITTITSDVNGAYSFANVTVGNTVVQVTVPTDTGDFTYTLTTAGEQNTSSTTADLTGVDFGINKVQVINYNISGTVFDDDNANGVNDAEAGLNGLTITLYSDNDASGTLNAGDGFITTTATATDGTYSFSNVTTENTLVAVTVPSNTAQFLYTPTTAVMLAVSSTTADVTGVDFGINEVEVTDYNITGTVFDDDNANGVNDAEGVLENVTVTLYNDVNADGMLDAGDTVITTTTTIANGTYIFPHVAVNNTVVAVTVPTNTVDFTYTLTTAGDQNTSSATTDVTGVDFGINKVQVIDYNISGTVFDDDNTNGVNDAEAGLNGLTITLYSDNDASGTLNAGDGFLGTTSTATDGTYSFLNVTTENTLVAVTVPSNTPQFLYTPTTAVMLAVSSTTADVTGVDFGINKVEIINYNVSGTVFDDNNESGVNDAGDGVLDGINITLYADNNQDGNLDVGDTTLSSTSTGVNGAYSFSNITTQYVLAVVTTPGNTATQTYVLTTSNTQAANSTTTDVTGLDFGINEKLVINYNISGIVFDDNDRNGVKDMGEGFIGAALLTLYADTNNDGVLDAGDTIITTTTTDIMSGNYGFTNVTVMNTIVQVTVPGNTTTFTFVPTSPVAEAVSSVMTNVTGVDFGIDRVQVVNYNISGTVFDDDNANGVIDEAGRLSNVTLTLYEDTDNNGTLGTADTVIGSTTSATDGTYTFSNVTARRTLVAVTVPANDSSFIYTLTTAATRVTSSIVTNVTGVNFGINQQNASYAISGNVFNDVNADGNNDATDGGLNNVTVNLYRDINQNGRIDRGEPLITTTTSDRNGNYQFTGVTDVFVVVQIVVPLNTPQFQYVATTAVSVALSTGATVINVDFGIQRTLIVLYNVRGYVWSDENADQNQDPLELRLEGIGVTLYEDVNGNGIIDAGTDSVVSTVFTSITGVYEFTNVNLANVIVAPILPSNGTYTTSGQLAVSSVNTDVNNVIFGIQITPNLFQVTGVVFDDDNENGIADVGEGSLDGLSVEIYADTDLSGTFDANFDVLIALTQTANGGFDFTNPNYFVDNIPPGQVFVVIVIPAPNPPFETWTPTYDPDSGTANPDGVFPTIMTGNIAGVNFGINYVDLNSTSRDANGADTMYTNAAEDVSERLRLYPNPTVSQIAINAEEFAGDVTVEIYNDRGYRVMTTTVSPFGNEVKVNVQRLAPGMYYAKFASRNKVASKKFIKR